MPTRGVLDRQRIGKALIAAARTHAEEVGPAARAVLSETVDDPTTLPDITAFYLQLAQHLEMTMNALVATDEAHLEEIDDDQDPRLRREEVADSLYRRLVEMRQALGGLYGADRGDTLLGVSGRTSRDPLTLHRLTTRVLERLRNPDRLVPLPESRLQGFQVDPLALAQELQPFIDELEQAIADVDRELRETETTKGERDKALEAFDTLSSAIGRIVSGCDDLAGFSHYADKIRLSLPPRGRRPPEEGDDEEVPLPDEGPPEDAVPRLGFEVPGEKPATVAATSPPPPSIGGE